MKFKQTPKIEKIEIEKKSVKKSSNKLRRTAIVFLCFFALTILILSSYGVYTFIKTYGFQTPILFQSPIYKLHPEVIVTPLAKPNGKIKSATLDLGKIADRIYTLESSNGKNDGCRKQGLYNGYGFRQNSREFMCYASPDEVRGHVITWLLQNIKDGNVEQALCYYNRGIRETGCTYAVNYNAL